MTLRAFTRKVNSICRQDAAKIMGIFKGIHYDYPEQMLRVYYAEGLSPRQTIDRLDEESESENMAESRMAWAETR